MLTRPSPASLPTFSPSTLDISARTVESHKYDLMEKLGVKTTAELIQYAIRRSIISS